MKNVWKKLWSAAFALSVAAALGFGAITAFGSERLDDCNCQTDTDCFSDQCCGEPGGFCHVPSGNCIWPSGAVPGAEVTLRRMGEISTQSAVTDSSGHARFARLLPGTYSVSVFRLLNDHEREGLRVTAKSLDDVNALGGASLQDVTPPHDSAAVSVVAGRRGSLVISELFHYTNDSVGDFGYRNGHYIELYNNSDSVIFLDGKLMARPYRFPWESSNYPCSLTDPWRLDPRGVWSNQYVKFPGRGFDYPVQPGQAVLVVMDAIDHSAFASGYYDLSRADFEYVGGADIDNRDVPNLIAAGARKWGKSAGKRVLYSGPSTI